MRFFTKLWEYTRIGKHFNRAPSGALDAPTLQTPTDGYTTADMTETFDCTDVTGAALYRFQLGSDPAFTIVFEEGTS